MTDSLPTPCGVPGYREGWRCQVAKGHSGQHGVFIGGEFYDWPPQNVSREYRFLNPTETTAHEVHRAKAVEGVMVYHRTKENAAINPCTCCADGVHIYGRFVRTPDDVGRKRWQDTGFNAGINRVIRTIPEGARVRVIIEWEEQS